MPPFTLLESLATSFAYWHTGRIRAVICYNSALYALNGAYACNDSSRGNVFSWIDFVTSEGRELKERRAGLDEGCYTTQISVSNGL